MFLSLKRVSLCVAIAVCSIGCQRQLKGRPAPDQEIYFPLGMAVNRTSPNIVYLMSTDWNQKYNTGWLSTIDLQPIIDSGGAVTSVAEVEQSRLNVPALGGELAMSADGSYLVTAFRQNNTIGIFEVQPDATLSCGDPQATHGLKEVDRRSDCDGRHLYNFTQEGVDHEFLQDEFRAPYGVRFVPNADISAPDTFVVGFLEPYRGKCLISFLDIDFGGVEEIVTNQRSIDLRQGIGNLSLQSAGVVAAHPDTSGGRYVGVGTRANQSGTTSATIFGVDLATFDFNAQVTDDDPNDNARTDAAIARIDIRSQSGGFSISDLRFSRDGSRAFAAISYAQPAAGSSDSVIMMDTTLRTRQIQLPQAQSVVVQRPEYVVLDALAIQGTPENVLYMERAGKAPLLVTATFNDNALHFVRVGPTSLNTITRLDRQTGAGPVMLAETHFAPTGDPGNVRDFVLVTAFLNHVLAIFDVTDDNPGNWRQYELSSDLPEGDRFH